MRYDQPWLGRPILAPPAPFSLFDPSKFLVKSVRDGDRPLPELYELPDRESNPDLQGENLIS
jgi:hypothetical protein